MGAHDNERSRAEPTNAPSNVPLADLADAFERAPVGMAITAERATILAANSALAAMLGYLTAELVGKSVVDITHPDDLAESLAYNDRLARGEIATFSLEKRYVHKNGGIVCVRVYVSRLDAHDSGRRHLVHVTDIGPEKASLAALRESEGRFREMAEAIEQDFWIMRVNPQELLYSSPAAVRLWGFDPMSNRDRPYSIMKHIHPEDVSTFSDLFDGVLTRAREREYRVVRADGATRWFRTRVFPVRDAAENVDRIAGITEDITPRKQAEQQAERHRGALAHALRVGTMGRLASGIAHELNQPLAAILNYASACDRYLGDAVPDKARLREVIGKIASQAMRAGGVISTLRALVSKSAGTLDWHSPNDLVRSALGFVEAETTDAGILVSVVLDPDVPEVQVDAIQIEQVVLNLARNAVDALRGYATAGRPEIRVATRLRDSTAVEISVADNGPGIDAARIGRIFEEFYTTKSDGLGLGLSISHAIIEAHGGNLWLDTDSPCGSTFRFTLPARM